MIFADFVQAGQSSWLTGVARSRTFAALLGAIAQLGERLHGMQEVDGSIPSSSTKTFSVNRRPHRLAGLGHRPFTAVTGVRIPLGTPIC